MVPALLPAISLSSKAPLERPADRRLSSGQMADWNQQVIDEFRANAGRVGGHFEGRPLLLLHHRGAKTGTERVNPVAYQRLSDDSVAVFASKGGAPTNPDWYHNLIANPRASIEDGKEQLAVTAVPAGPDERSRLWAMITEKNPAFADYQRKTTRTIPVVILTPDV